MIDTTVTRSAYTGNGTTNEYDYDYKIYDRGDLIVTVTDLDEAHTTLVIDTDYDVSDVGASAGGTITLVDAAQDWIDDDGFLKSGYGLLIRRVMDIKQETDIRNQDNYYPEIHEDALDKKTMQIQQVDDMARRSIRAMETEDVDDLYLPSATDRANRFLAFDTDGVPYATRDVIDSTAVPVSAFGEQLVAKSTAEEARDLLGFTGVGGTVPTVRVEDLAVTTAKINDLAVTTGKLAAGAVTAAKIDASVFYDLTAVTPQGVDYVPIADASDSNAKKKVLISSIKNAVSRSVVNPDNATGDIVTADDETIIVSGTAGKILLPALSGSGKRYRVVHAGTNFVAYTFLTTDGNTIGGIASGSYAHYTNTEITELQDIGGTDWLITAHRAVTAWTAYTPTFQSSLGTCTSINFEWMRDGTQIHIIGNATTGIVGAANTAGFTLPSSILPYVPDSVVALAGTWVRGDSTVNAHGGMMLALSADNIVRMGHSTTFGSGAIDPDAPVAGSSILANTTLFRVNYSGPIVGWQP
jgi:hypothetical protein